MLLTIDVGNTNIEFGLYDLTKKDLLGTFRLMTKGSQTSDEIGLTLCDYLNRFGWQPEQIEDVIIASVVPGIMYSLKNAMVKYLGRRPLVINEDVFAELGYLGGATTNEHGADRSVACMAAASLPPAVSTSRCVLTPTRSAASSSPFTTRGAQTRELSRTLTQGPSPALTAIFGPLGVSPESVTSSATPICGSTP